MGGGAGYWAEVQGDMDFTVHPSANIQCITTPCPSSVQLITLIPDAAAKPQDYPWVKAHWPIVAIGTGLVLAAIAWYNRKAIGRYFRA